MGRITVCRNPLQPDQLEYFRHAGPFIDWLQVHFPDGFGAPTIIVCNGRRLHTPDFDYVVGPDDEVYLVADPGATVIVGALVSAAISAALSFVTDWIFATPDSPSEAQQPSPVYSLSVPTNQARLGQVVPVQYGEVLAVPDIASQPYTWFANNEQYLGMLLCLGQGEFQVDSVQVADTPEDQLAANVVVWQDFGPGDHQQTMGVIQAQTGVWENVDTSPEVSDQELVPGDIQTLFATGIDPNTRTITFADPIASAAVVGGELELSDATPNNGTYTIESIAGDRLSCVVVETMSTAGYSFSVSTNVAISIFDDFTTQMDWDDTGISGSWAGADADITLVGHSTLTSLAGKLRWFEPTNLGVDDPITVSDPGGATSADVVITPASTGTVKFLQESQVGPYVASSPGTTATILSFDIVWPGGLYVTLDDKLGYRRVDWQFTIEQIDDNGTVIGAPIVKSEALILDTNTPQRRTYSYTVPVGRYRASAERLTGLDEKASTVDKFVWTGLKALLSLTTTPVYGTTTLIAMTIKATNGLASDAQNRIGVRCTRILDYVSPTVNPADAFQDIFTNTVYGGARPLTELDTTKLAALKASWAAHSGFNAVFDAKETVWTALQRSVQVVNSYPVVIDGKVSLVQDGPSTVVSQAFTADNIVKDSLTISYRFDELDGIDGYETEYRDPVSFTPLYSTYPSTAVNPEKVNLFGCVDATTGASFAQLLWQKRLYRRKTVEFETELIGLLPAVNDRINITHRLIGDGVTPERYIVVSTQPGDGYRVTVSAMIDDTRVFDGVGMALRGIA